MSSGVEADSNSRQEGAGTSGSRVGPLTPHRPASPVLEATGSPREPKPNMTLTLHTRRVPRKPPTQPGTTNQPTIIDFKVTQISKLHIAVKEKDICSSNSLSAFQ
jgi:hypothetical protein